MKTMNIKEQIILILISFFVFCLFYQPCLSVDDIGNITVSDLNPLLEVLQGQCKSVPFHITNRYNESIHIYYRIDKPSDMEITSYPKDYTLLNSGETIAGNLNVCINEYFESDTYIIKFWLETLTKVNETRIKSDKYPIEINVLHNPNLETTTITTVVETTTIGSQTIMTIPSFTTIPTEPTTTIEDGYMPRNGKKFNLGDLIDRRKVVVIIVIIILLILVIIPYLTFKKGEKME